MTTMKSMTNMTIRNAIWGSIAALLLNCGLFCQQAQAALISGNITFTGTVSLDTASAGTATMVTAWFSLPPLGGSHEEQKSVVEGETVALAGDRITFSETWTLKW